MRPPPSKRTPLWLSHAFLTLCIVAGLAMAIVGWQRKSRSTESLANATFPIPPLLSVGPDRLSLGTVWEQPEFPWTLPIHNNSDHAIEIAEFNKSCSCVNIEPRSLAIPAGETRDVLLTFDLRTNRPVTSAERPYSVEIFPVIRGETKQQQRWIIEGFVRSSLAFSAAPGFGEYSEFAQPIPPTRTEITTMVPISNLTAVCSDPRFDVQIHAIFGKTGTYELTMAPTALLAIGSLNFTVALNPTLANGEAIPVYRLPVKGQILNDIVASPSSVSFGAIGVGGNAEESVTLSSRTSRAFEIVRWESKGLNLIIEKANELPNTLRFRIKVAATGAQFEPVTIYFRANGREESVTLPVRYFGMGKRHMP